MGLSNMFTRKPERMPDNWIVTTYPSIAATARVDTVPRAFPGQYDASETLNGSSWAPLDYASTIATVRAGGYSAADHKAIAGLVDASKLPAYMRPVMRRQVRNAPTGRHVNIQRAMAGDLAPMHTIRKGARVQRSIHIGMNLSCSGITPARTMALRGAALMAVIDALETAGVSVEFTGYSADGQRNTTGLYFAVKLKAANARLDPGSFAFAVANPSYARRVVFRAQENEPSQREHLERDYGHGQDQYVAGNFDLCLPYYMHGVEPSITNEASAIAYVVAALESTEVGQAWKCGELR